jgi:bacterioferritin
MEERTGRAVGNPGSTTDARATHDGAPRQEIMARLNELFAEEVEASLRYLHLSVTLKGLDRLVVRKTLLEGVQETLEHAQAIADKIVQLGGYPSLKIRVELPPEKTTGADAIRTALDCEQAALDAYRELLDTLEDDDELADFVREQVAVESAHVSELSLLLEE